MKCKLYTDPIPTVMLQPTRYVVAGRARDNRLYYEYFTTLPAADRCAASLIRMHYRKVRTCRVDLLGWGN